MRIRRRFATWLVLVLAAGCSSTIGNEGGEIVNQTEFDLTSEVDRAHFTPTDLELREVVGPYAVYEVTGMQPRLDGPRLRVWIGPSGGTAMLCSANAYFALDRAESPPITVQLVRGVGEEGVLAEAHQEALQLGEDRGAGASDEYGEPLPEPDLESEVQPEARSIALQFDPMPPVGAWILLRRLAVSSFDMGHNGANQVPRARCFDAGCVLVE